MRKDGADAPKVAAAKDEDPGNPSVNFRGEKRGNNPHQSGPEADSGLSRKAHGKEARLCWGGPGLRENRHGRGADSTLHHPSTEPAPGVALRQMAEHTQLHAGV